MDYCNLNYNKKTYIMDKSPITNISTRRRNVNIAIITGAFYKGYRLMNKILPSALMIKIVGKGYGY